MPAWSQTAYDVESDQLEIFNMEGRAIFQGNVHLWNDTTSIRSNRLEVYYVSQGDTIDYLEAFGDVKIDRDSMKARSNYAYYHVQNDTALLQEDAYVRRDGSEFWADEIQIDMTTERIRMRDNVRGHLVNAKDDTGADS